MTKFGIDIGHNCPPDTGAVGIKKEDELTMAVGTRLIKKLEAAGHQVINCTPRSASSVRESLQKRVDTANNAGVDVFVSIHFNSFNGNANGTEIFGMGNESQQIARKVLAEIVKLGFKDKGVKTANFFVLKHTQMPAILVECCFCDSMRDMGIFDVEEMADAIAKGLGITPTDPDRDYTLKVTVPTVLKPSTEQAVDIEREHPGSCIDIGLGNYQIEDLLGSEEGHYHIKWKDASQGSREAHFVFAGHAKVVEV
ncbi:N-acetylmuramoyl-L-alanine amidase [Oscillatoria sp. FACHB-1406]|uniref:N-acetylmuramoyl-L-alanine amidase n=1 Tax=Oscillatoria sp. FACHB-1406 TaxID=2692846 RepID=UPI001683E09D|nr:N-acetylmuramoyl-L-alanine amidase [Oscillatoria sp. FACHB-1406]MBD2579784.1 N-acetylmuramoyl-L-alanine amidase [Oscillatoria sp. FACHB-1406]